VRKVLVGANVAVVVLILVQAMLAGQSLFGTASITVHGFVGNATFAVAVLAAFLALLAKVPVWVLSLDALLALLLFFQTGLGYVGRDSTLAASWHIPLGVTAFGLATAALLGSILVAGSVRPASAPSSDRT
jgi:hypothetical protein